MAEYIDREKAIKIAEKYGLDCGSVIGRHSGIADCIASELAGMEFFDDVEPMAHGTLIEDEYTYPGPGLANYKCTVCGKINGSWRKGLAAKELPSFCWNCGAKMDGGSDE